MVFRRAQQMSTDRTDSPVHEPRLPQIDGARCTHALVVAASCEACVASCPRGAWVMGEDALALDTEACDGCAICVAVCPQHAITLDREPVFISVNEPAVALAACTREVAEPGAGVMPCLNAISRDELARLHAGGVRELVIARGACAACPSGGRARLETALSDVARMTAERKLPRLTVTELAGAAWSGQRETHRRPNRRAFFRSLAVKLDDGGGLERDARAPAAMVLSGAAGLASAPVGPVISAAACEACDACVRICGAGAIALSEAGAGIAAYAIDARRCTGCRLCVDVCEAAAVSLVSWPVESAVLVPLRVRRCAGCGNTFRVTAARGEAGERCRICAATGHTRKLFQVLP